MKKISIEIKWAILFCIISLLWMLFERGQGWHGEKIAQQATYTNLFAIPAIILFVLALLDKRRNYYGGVMSWKQGFICGLIISLIVAILSPLTQWITATYISPDYFQNIIDYSVQTGELERADAEKHFNLQSYMWMSSLGAIIMGVVTSAIVALFTMKKRRK